MARTRALRLRAPQKLRAPLGRQHPQLAKRGRHQRPARHAEITSSRKEQLTVIGKKKKKKRSCSNTKNNGRRS